MFASRSLVCALLLAAVAAVCAAPAANSTDSVNVESRIVGGQTVASYALTYVASLQSTQKGHLCGAAIINRRHLLTAARCTAYQTVSQLRVRIGSKNKYQSGVLLQVASTRQHPQYDSYNLLNDLAVVRTKEQIVYTQWVSAVPVAPYSADAALQAVVAGWGKTNNNWDSGSETLRQLNTRTITNYDCKQRYAHKPQLAANIRNGNICTLSSARGVCDGDNGGPLVVNGELVGLVSWATRECATGYPDVYTRLAPYKTWIQQNSRENY